MKRVFKSISVLVLSLSLALSGFVFTGNVKADTESDWIANAIITPAEGSLVGAGYIEVKFDNSLSGYEYEVFLDDQPVYWIGNNIVKTEIGEEITSSAQRKKITSSEAGVTEVYTTQVKEHKLLVKATKGGKTITSNYRTFYVSKKGLAMGDNMGDKVKLSKLNCSWYYNWGTKAFNNSVDNNNGVPHIPMMWGGYEDSIEDIQNLNTTANYILGFNEPDIQSQANMGFWDGVKVWNQYIKPLKLRKVSPAPAAPGGNSSWLRDFINGNDICQLEDGTWDYYYWYADNPNIKKVEQEGVGLDGVDSVCLHYYRNTIDAQGIVDAVDTLWNTYHKPIWITEIGLFGKKGTYTDMSYELEDKRIEIQNYLKSVVASLDAKPYVERYCWFPYDIDSTNEIDAYDGGGGTAMFEYASGKYTELGKIYSKLGIPSGYTGETITDAETFNYAERITKPSPTAETTKAPTQAPTKKQTTTKAPTKPGKVTLSKVQNVKKKSAKVIWKSVSGANKYKIQYALNKKFTKKCKTKYSTKTTIKIAKLKKKKKYFFRVAAVNSVGTGAWSNVKKVKIKK